MIEYSDIKQLGGGKHLFHLVFPGHRRLLKEVLAGSQGKDLKVGLLAVLHSMTFNMVNRSSPRKLSRNHGGWCWRLGPSSQGMLPPTGDWTFLHQSINGQDNSPQDQDLSLMHELAFWNPFPLEDALLSLDVHGGGEGKKGAGERTWSCLN